MKVKVEAETPTFVPFNITFYIETRMEAIRLLENLDIMEKLYDDNFSTVFPEVFSTMKTEVKKYLKTLQL